ncbi:MAG TPA: D-alanyl-D-alanine carboxypeptidase/D-alanyl-D-alanine-endopeptidase [Acidimicrobiales bacterium]|nr:D-alanyl-D-alanine carboxypeptidase/D-alanyl-D-alanine-endopeptidase [Acidimicrobiales bacterium]
MRLRILVLAVLVAAVGLAPTPAGAAPTPSTTGSAPALRLVTPVFSLRRVAGVLAGTVADSHLGSDLDKVMTDPAIGGARDNSCLVVGDAGGGTSHYAHAADQGYIPASTLKLLTTDAALAQLGPDSHFTTEIRAGAAPADGAVGDLFMVGGGDPLLATADFAVDAGYQGQSRLATSMEALADKVVATGIRRVGRILGDDSRYDDQRLVPTWKPSYVADFEISPLSALVVNKGFASTKPPVEAASPAAHAAGVLATLLRARGVTVGATGAAKAPAGAPLVTSIDSPPLTDVVGEILQNSDNMGAEMLLKELGVRAGGAGSTAAGLGVAATLLQKVAGISPNEMSVVDGSGLDRSDRVTCAALERVLDRSGETGDLGKALSTAGQSGTLQKRFGGTPAAGKVRAKTGSLSGVTGLAGFATAQNGQELSFALLANELPSDAAGTTLQDKVVSVLATYPRAPAADELAPLPPAAPSG